MRLIIKVLLSIGLLLPATLPGKATDAVTLRLKWLNQAQFGGYYVAKDKGYYAAAGLDVSIQPGGSDFPAIQMVAGGSEQFGVTGADQILIARSKGVPVVAIAVIYRESPFVLFALKKSGITKATEFSGRNVGLKIGGSEELIYRSVLKSAGVDKASLHEMPVKFDLSPLLTGQVDIWPGYVINEVIAAEEKGFDVSVIKPSDYGVRMYADTLFTTERMLKEQPELVKKFVAATVHGWTDAVADPYRRGAHDGQVRQQARIRARTGDDESQHSAHQGGIGPDRRLQGGGLGGHSDHAGRRRLPEGESRCQQGLHQPRAA